MDEARINLPTGVIKHGWKIPKMEVRKVLKRNIGQKWQNSDSHVWLPDGVFDFHDDDDDGDDDDDDDKDSQLMVQLIFLLVENMSFLLESVR